MQKLYHRSGRKSVKSKVLDLISRHYIGEHTDFIFRDWQRYGELLELLESDRLAKAISRLKDRDRELLFARVYGELTFAELGERFHI